MDDLISRQAAIDAVHKSILDFFDICDDDEESPMTYKDERLLEVNKVITTQIKAVPSAEPTLYGYKIEHLAYIARVMEKEGVTADYAVRTFDDMSRALRMIIEEAQERVMETLNERYDLQTGGD